MKTPLHYYSKQLKNEKRNPLSESYTNYLFSKGEDKILKKIGEECTEVIIASKNNDNEELVKEMVDVMYHCFVLLAEKYIIRRYYGGSDRKKWEAFESRGQKRNRYIIGEYV